MPSVGFEPTIPSGEWPQTYALDRAATGTGEPTIPSGEWPQTYALDRVAAGTGEGLDGCV